MSSPTLSLSAVTLGLDATADACRRADLDDVDPGEAEAALRASDVMRFEAGALAGRIKAACERAGVNGTPRPGPVVPMPQPKPPAPPEEPKDTVVVPFTSPGRPRQGLGTVDRGRIVLEMLQEAAGTIRSADRASRMAPSEWSAHQLAAVLELVASMGGLLGVMGRGLDSELRGRVVWMLERER